MSKFLYFRHIGDAIRIARERRGLYQYQLARMVHVSKSALSRIELGQVRLDDELLCRIARALNYPALLQGRCECCSIRAGFGQHKAA